MGANSDSGGLVAHLEGVASTMASEKVTNFTFTIGRRNDREHSDPTALSDVSGFDVRSTAGVERLVVRLTRRLMQQLELSSRSEKAEPDEMPFGIVRVLQVPLDGERFDITYLCYDVGISNRRVTGGRAIYFRGWVDKAGGSSMAAAETRARESDTPPLAVAQWPTRRIRMPSTLGEGSEEIKFAEHGRASVDDKVALEYRWRSTLTEANVEALRSAMAAAAEDLLNEEWTAGTSATTVHRTPPRRIQRRRGDTILPGAPRPPRQVVATATLEPQPPIVPPKAEPAGAASQVVDDPEKKIPTVVGPDPAPSSTGALFDPQRRNIIVATAGVALLIIVLFGVVIIQKLTERPPTAHGVIDSGTSVLAPAANDTGLNQQDQPATPKPMADAGQRKSEERKAAAARREKIRRPKAQQAAKARARAEALARAAKMVTMKVTIAVDEKFKDMMAGSRIIVGSINTRGRGAPKPRFFKLDERSEFEASIALELRSSQSYQLSFMNSTWSTLLEKERKTVGSGLVFGFRVVDSANIACVNKACTPDEHPEVAVTVRPLYRLRMPKTPNLKDCVLKGNTGFVAYAGRRPTKLAKQGGCNDCAVLDQISIGIYSREPDFFANQPIRRVECGALEPITEDQAEHWEKPLACVEALRKGAMISKCL